MNKLINCDKELIIDFHSHILQGIDDGSKSIEESMRMLEFSRESGVECVVLTPHFYADRWNPEKFLSSRAYAFERLCSATENIGVMLALGAEVEYFEGISAMDELQLMKISGTDAVMIEMPFCPWSKRVVRDIVEIAGRRNYRVIIAHIERYIDYQNEGTIESLLDAGVIMQANANSFMGLFRSRKCMNMLKNGLIHVIGSDCHNMTVRPPNLMPALNSIRKKCGDAVLHNVISAGNAILFGE